MAVLLFSPRGLGNVAVVPMRPAPFSLTRTKGGDCSVPDVLGWFGRFFYLAFFFCTASLGMRVTGGRGAGRLGGLVGLGGGRGRGEGEGATPHRYYWLDESCKIPLMIMRRGDAGDDILVFAGGTV